MKQSLPELLQKFNLNLESTKVTESGVQDLMQSLPEFLQQFDLNLYSPRCPTLGRAVAGNSRRAAAGPRYHAGCFDPALRGDR